MQSLKKPAYEELKQAGDQAIIDKARYAWSNQPQQCQGVHCLNIPQYHCSLG